ncbi:unnamed protein product, partial [Musa textilis]
VTSNVIDSSTDHSFHVNSVDTIQMEVYCNKQRQGSGNFFTFVFPCSSLLLRVEEEGGRGEKRGVVLGGGTQSMHACVA